MCLGVSVGEEGRASYIQNASFSGSPDWGWPGWWTKTPWGRDTAGPQRPGNKSGFVPL